MWWTTWFNLIWTYDPLTIWGVKSFSIFQPCKGSRWARKNKMTTSINLSKWWEDNFKGKLGESLLFHHCFCSANPKVNADLPGQSPSQTSDLNTPSPGTVFVTVRRGKKEKENNYASAGKKYILSVKNQEMLLASYFYLNGKNKLQKVDWYTQRHTFQWHVSNKKCINLKFRTYSNT